jgi:hypothetical protein
MEGKSSQLTLTDGQTNRRITFFEIKILVLSFLFPRFCAAQAESRPSNSHAIKILRRVLKKEGLLDKCSLVCDARFATPAGARRKTDSRGERFLFQLLNPLLQELPFWFLLGQGQSFLI